MLTDKQGTEYNDHLSAESKSNRRYYSRSISDDTYDIRHNIYDDASKMVSDETISPKDVPTYAYISIGMIEAPKTTRLGDIYFELEQYGLTRKQQVLAWLLIKGYGVKELSGMYGVGLQAMYKRIKALRDIIGDIIGDSQTGDGGRN